MERKHYDLVVIGGGPAGEKGAAQVAYFGKSVAIVEMSAHFGGAAANTGTIPSKTLRETSLILSAFKARRLFGVDLTSGSETNVEQFLHQERKVKDSERQRIDNNLHHHQIDTYHGVASFVDSHTIRVDGADQTVLEGDVVLLATGSSPRHPSEYPFGDNRVYDSDSILSLNEMPKRMIVVGGGVIGTEYACTFATLGIEITLIDPKDVLLGFLDREVSISLMNRMRDSGIEIRHDAIETCTADDDAVRLQLASGETVECDAVLVCAGRTSNIEHLALDAAGVQTAARGLIVANENFQTNVPHIYAVGDVVGFPALASTSMEQARWAMVHAFQLGYKRGVVPVLPYGVYSIPEVSMAGATEEELTQRGVDYVVGRARYADQPRGMIMGESDGFLKLIFAFEDMQLLGVHVIGEQATELVHIGLMALMVEGHAQLFIRACFNYPTLGDLYKYATYDAMGARQSRLIDTDGDDTGHRETSRQ